MCIAAPLPVNIRHRYTVRISQGGVCPPFDTGCLPLNYSSNPGANVSHRVRRARVLCSHWRQSEREGVKLTLAKLHKKPW